MRDMLSKHIMCLDSLSLFFYKIIIGVRGVVLMKKCIVCGKSIPKGRLEALPDTNRCVECAKRLGSDVSKRKTILSMDADTYRDLLGATRS